MTALGSTLPTRDGVTVRIQYTIKRGPRGDIQYHQVFVAGRLVEGRLGVDDHSDLTLVQTYKDSIAMIRGQLDPNAAFMQGRIKVSGQIQKMMIMMPLTNSPEYREIQRLMRELGEEAASVDGSPVDSIALTLIDGVLRLATVSADGTYQFLDQQNLRHHIVYLEALASATYAGATEELEDLINSGATEAQLQEFFERYPDFLTGHEYVSAHSHLVLRSDDRKLIPDFMLEPANPRQFCDVMELKLPTARLVVERGGRSRLSSALLDVSAQLREYSEYFDTPGNRQRIQDAYGLNVFRPRMLAVIGLRQNIDPLALRRAENELPFITIRTYDDLIEQIKRRGGHRSKP